MPRYDLMFQLLDPTTSQYAGSNFTFNMSAPLAVRGLQKLANRFIKIFMTPKGSNPIRRQEGTQFPFLIGANIDPKEDLAGAMLTYIDDAVTQIQAIDLQSPWLDPDEKIRAVNILRFNQISNISIEVWVNVINMANSQLAVLIPYVTG